MAKEEQSRGKTKQRKNKAQEATRMGDVQERYCRWKLTERMGTYGQINDLFYGVAKTVYDMVKLHIFAQYYHCRQVLR